MNRLGRWTLLTRQGSKTLCRCDCGTERLVVTGDLRRGVSKSCGCLSREITSVVSRRVNTKHGMEGTAIYRIWIDMRRRCEKENRPDYHRYGGRGIAVCEEWRSFEKFFKDMGDRPSPQHSLERKDNDGPYCKGNCIWATKVEQGANTRKNRHITAFGETITLATAAKRHGISRVTIATRLDAGWPPEKALTQRPRHFKTPLKKSCRLKERPATN